MTQDSSNEPKMTWTGLSCCSPLGKPTEQADPATTSAPPSQSSSAASPGSVSPAERERLDDFLQQLTNDHRQHVRAWDASILGAPSAKEQESRQTWTNDTRRIFHDFRTWGEPTRAAYEPEPNLLHASVLAEQHGMYGTAVMASLYGSDEKTVDNVMEKVYSTLWGREVRDMMDQGRREWEEEGGTASYHACLKSVEEQALFVSKE